MFAIAIIILIAVPFALVLAGVTYATVRTLFTKGPILAALGVSLLGAIGIALSAAGVAAFKRRARTPDMKRRTSSDQPARPSQQGLNVDDIRRLVVEINDILRSSPISTQQRADLTAHLRDVPANLTRAVGRLNRLRRIRDIANRAPDTEYSQQVRRDLDAVETEVQTQVYALHKTLLDMSVVLLRVDKASTGRSLERLMTELSTANERLEDIAASYDDIQTCRVMNLQ